MLAYLDSVICTYAVEGAPSFQARARARFAAMRAAGAETRLLWEGERMPTLDDFFVTSAEPPHPRLRDWTRRLADANASASLEVFLPKGEFGQGKPEMCVQFTEE